MQRYFLSRLGQSVLLLFGVLLLVFAMVRVTGDPAALMMSRQASPEDLEEFRERMGFNDPTLVQFGRFISGAVVGDFGDSLHFKTPALPMVMERLPATLQLALTALIMAVVVGIPLGLVGGFNPGSFIDNIARGLALLGQSVPNFWLALIMISFFAVNLRWFPTFGRDEWKSVIMPKFGVKISSAPPVVKGWNAKRSTSNMYSGT
jgi:peptide/nickel transport system permease protein